MTRHILFLIALPLVACGDKDSSDDTGDVSDCPIVCSSSCEGAGFEMSCEDGSLSDTQSCDLGYDEYGNVSRATCEGSRSYSSSEETYTYTVEWKASSCSVTVDVDGHGSCSDG